MLDWQGRATDKKTNLYTFHSVSQTEPLQSHRLNRSVTQTDKRDTPNRDIKEREDNLSLKTDYLAKTTPPINDYAFWEWYDGKPAEQYYSQVVNYWAHAMLVEHGRRIPLTEAELIGKAKDVARGAIALLYECEGDDCLKEYIDWFMNDYAAAAKQWAWRWLVDRTFTERFLREREEKPVSPSAA